MADTLQICGIEYQNISGFKVTDTNGNKLYYVKPNGNINITSNGSVDVKQYETLVTNVTPNLQTKPGIVPSSSDITITADTGFDGLGEVNIVGDVNLIPENIKNGISIFGVTGTNQGGGTQEVWVQLLSSTSLVTSAVDEVGSFTAVRSHAFRNRINLTIAHFSAATTLGDFAFCSCSKLSDIDFRNATYIGQRTFLSCMSISEITNANFGSVSYISDYAFGFCSSLTKIDSNPIEHIGSNAFLSCINISYANLPQVITIDSSAFMNCSSLNLVNIQNAQYLGEMAFQGCAMLESITILASSVDARAMCFRNCATLSSVRIPYLSSISAQAFSACYQLGHVRFPLVENVGSSAFYNCSNISYIILGESVSVSYSISIFSYAFYNCLSLKSLYILHNTRIVNLYTYALSGTPIFSGSGTIYVRESLYSSYIKANGWSSFSSYIQSMTDSEIETFLRGTPDA